MTGHDPFAHPLQLEGAAIDPPVVFFEDWLTAGYNQNDSSGKISETEDDADWHATIVNTATDETIVVADDVVGGVLQVANGAADNDVISCILNGTPFQVAADKDIVFKAKLKLTAATTPLTTIDWAIGLVNGGTDECTNIVTAANLTDFIGFHGGTTILTANGATANVIATVGTALAAAWTSTTAQTAADTCVDYVDDTFIDLSFHVHSNSWVTFFVDGAKVHESYEDLPSTVKLAPGFCVQNNGSESKIMEIDYIYCKQER
jgi:hypothetical protein